MAVWVETPRPERLQRGLARDGEEMRSQWLAWMAEEDRHFAADRTRERATLQVERSPCHAARPEQRVRRAGPDPPPVRVHQSVTLGVRQVLRRFAHGDPRGPMRARRQPIRHLIRPALADLAQHPADRLADEELLLVEHRVGVAQEPIERRPVAQRPQPGEQGRAPDPEVVVGRPSVEHGAGPHPVGRQHGADHVDRQPVDQRPGERLAQEALEQRQVADGQQVGCAARAARWPPCAARRPGGPRARPPAPAAGRGPGPGAARPRP